MEIYEADSRINAAPCRTAFRAMGRAFFRTGRGRSWPHFTINVLFFRLFRCVPFLTPDSAAKQTYAPRFSIPPQFRDAAQRSDGRPRAMERAV
jgi:hypothetical protein